MAKRGMRRDGEHPSVTKNKKKHKAEAHVPLIQGDAKSGKKKVEGSNPPPENER